MITNPQNDLRVTKEAANWFMELQTEGPACYSDFSQWLRRSPQHVEEFLAITGMSKRLDNVDPHHRINVRELMAGSDAEIVKLLPTIARKKPSSLNRRIVGWWTTGLVTACALTAAFIVQYDTFQSDTYATGVGEQRSFKLKDGSLIYLNTHSRVQVSFSSKTRDIRLVQGEALFTVQSDPGRPFRVLSNAATVQALGTQFNVYRLRSGITKVSVVEGVVQVSTKSLSTDNSAKPVREIRKISSQDLNETTRLSAGEQATVLNNHIRKQALPDVQNAIAWRERKLVFRDKPLTDVVNEFNRYNSIQFSVEIGAENEPLSGVFAADRPESLVLFLRKDKALQVERKGDRFIIHARNAEQ